MSNNSNKVVDVHGLTTKTNVVIVKDGVVSVVENVSPAKAYHITDDFSVSIHNGHLTTPKDVFIWGVSNTNKGVLVKMNCNTNHPIFVLVSKDMNVISDLMTNYAN